MCFAEMKHAHFHDAAKLPFTSSTAMSFLLTCPSLTVQAKVAKDEEHKLKRAELKAQAAKLYKEEGEG